MSVFAFLEVVALICAMAGISIAGFWSAKRFSNIGTAIGVGVLLAIAAGIFGGMVAGHPGAALRLTIIVPIVVFAAAIAVGRFIRQDSVDFVAGDAKAYVDYLNMQFSSPIVAVVPWVAQEWRRMSDSEKTALVERARAINGEQLVQAQDKPVWLYQILYATSLNRHSPSEYRNRSIS